MKCIECHKSGFKVSDINSKGLCQACAKNFQAMVDWLNKKISAHKKSASE